MIAAIRRLARGLALRLIGAPPVADGDLSALTAAWHLLHADERRVLGEIAARLLGGWASYGALHIASDRRDWAREEREERLDGAVYAACACLAPTTPATIDSTIARAERLAVRLERGIALRRAEAARDQALGETEATIAEIGERARQRGGE